MVYVREAHPSDAWQLEANLRDEVVLPSPASYEQKVETGRACATRLGIEFPTLIDEFDSRTEIAYTAWPDRLYVVGADGAVAYKSKPGPFGFKPDEVARTLAAIVGDAP